jgi:hypothetical protein
MVFNFINYIVYIYQEAVGVDPRPMDHQEGAEGEEEEEGEGEGEEEGVGGEKKVIPTATSTSAGCRRTLMIGIYGSSLRRMAGFRVAMSSAIKKQVLARMWSLTRMCSL